MTDENTGTPEEIEYGEHAVTESPNGYVPPQHPALPEARYSVNFAPGKPPLLTVRGQTAAEMTAALNELESYGVYANIAAAYASLEAQGPLGKSLGPVTPVNPPPLSPAVQQVAASYPTPAPTPPPGPQGPAPAWAAPAAPPPYGGGGQTGRPDPKPQPPGWYRTNSRSGPGYDAWKAMREANKDYVKGKIQWGGESTFWIEPSIAQWIAQSGWPVTQ